MKKIFFLVSFLVISLGFGQEQNPAAIDESYSYEGKAAIGGGIIKVQSDGKILVLGGCYVNNLVKGNIFRLNQDFTIDETFSIGVLSGLLRNLAIQNDGKILVSGGFTKLNNINLPNSGISGVTTVGLIRLNSDGTLDTTFNYTNAGNIIDKVEVQTDGKILQMSSTGYLNRLNTNGTVDYTFRNGFNNAAYSNLKNFWRLQDNRIAVLVQNNDGMFLYVQDSQGLFSSPSNFQSLPINNSNVGMPSSGVLRVNAVIMQPDGKLLVGGEFNKYDGVNNVSRLMRLNIDGSLDTSFDTGNELILNSGFNPIISGVVKYCRVNSIAIQSDGKVLIGGIFDKYNNFISKGLVRLNSNGSIDLSYDMSKGIDGMENDNNAVNDIILIQSGAIITQKQGISTYKEKYIVRNTFAINNSGDLKSNSSNNFDATKIIKDSNGNALLVGRSSFTNQRGLKLTNPNGDIITNPNLTLGFDWEDNVSFSTISMNNFQVESCFDAEIQPDGKIIVCGVFRNYNNTIANRIIRLNSDYTIDSSFNTGSGFNASYAVIRSIVLLQTGKIIVAGSLGGVYNGTSFSGNIIRLNSDGSFDTSFNYIGSNSEILQIEAQSDGKIICSNGQRLNQDGSVDNSFTNSGISVNFKILTNDKIMTRQNDSIVRLNSNGTLDNTFTPFLLSNALFNVFPYYFLEDGTFLTSMLVSSNVYKLIRVKNDSTIDQTFNSGFFNGAINSIYLETDGRILVSGSFNRYNGAWCNGSIRLLGNNALNVFGKNRVDTNLNGCDNNDMFLSNLKYKISYNGVNNDYISNNSGSYSIFFSSGNHTITPTFENPSYFTVSPTNISVSFPTQPSPVIQDFCITPNGVHPDLEITLLPLTVARPGFQAKYRLVYKNKGNQLQSGTVNFNFNDAVLNFVSATTAISSQTLNNLNWNFTNLMPLETREITITLNVNSPTSTPPVASGFVLNYTTSVSSTLTDEMPSDNTFTFNQTVVNSFDPNDKTCLEGASIATTKVGDYVHYMIRFENTGSYNAQNITVKDVIDTTKYDINTLLPTSGSHPFITRILEGNRAEFYFENINLPFADATNDGYVAFKIKTKSTLVAGDSFSNSAGIYFDYNYPITTNTATTTITALSSQDFTFNDYFSVYPNPVENNLNISKKEEIEISSITIYNMLGQIVVAIPNAKNVENVDVSSLKSGNYFVKINTDKGNSNTKFIKL